MFYRALPTKLGVAQVYNPGSAAFTTGGWQAAFDTIDRSSTAPTVAELAAGRLGELSASYISKLQVDWYTCVLTYNAATAPTYCG
jgi:hypothetical protein